MRPPLEVPADIEPFESARQPDARELRVEGRNFLWLVIHHVMLRIGWIFKTESVVMPIFMEVIGGGPILQGCLIVFNRLGFSVPPVLFSRRLNVTPYKKWALAGCSLGMAAMFGLLAVLWASGWWRAEGGHPAWWMPWAFIGTYGVFFALTGMNQLAAHALHGKLVRVNRRGWLFTASALVGTPIAIACAATLMPRWLDRGSHSFELLFGFTALMFLLGSAASLLLVEAPDSFEQQRSRPVDYFRLAFQALVRDANCRRLALLAGLFSTTFMLFPHYQRVVRGFDGVDLGEMTLWVCMQNGAAALFSLVTGPLSDRYGNRLALHITMLGATSAPFVGLALLFGDDSWRQSLGWLVFVPLGFTPVTIRLLLDYALEIAPRHDHPRYVSAVGLCLAVPVFVGAPSMGLLIRLTGYGPAMVLGLVLLVGAVVQSFRIAEPRHATLAAGQDGPH